MSTPTTNPISSSARDAANEPRSTISVGDREAPGPSGAEVLRAERDSHARHCARLDGNRARRHTAATLALRATSEARDAGLAHRVHDARSAPVSRHAVHDGNGTRPRAFAALALSLVLAAGIAASACTATSTPSPVRAGPSAASLPVPQLAPAGQAAPAAPSVAPAPITPITRNRQLESFERAARWPDPSVTVVMSLANEYTAGHHEREGYAFFDERARAVPERSLFTALAGMFQARLISNVAPAERAAWIADAAAKLDRAAAAGGGLERFLRGSVLAEFPARAGRAQQAADDLEWMLAHAEQFPPGLRRGAWRGLASAYTALGRAADAAHARELAGPDALPLVTDHSVNQTDGFRFSPRRLRELPGGIFVATGYDFADIAFVTVAGGVVAIDAGTTEANAAAALAALHHKTTAPVVAVIVTHAHWDHIGGLGAYAGPGVQVIAQAHFADELRIVNGVGQPFRYFFGTASPASFRVTPQRTIAAPETVTIGGRRFGLYPAHGGETADALLVHLPDAGVMFVGDAFMPYFGAPFAPEGSIDGLFDTIAQITKLAPTTLIHGHDPLTQNFTAETLAPLATALAVVRDHAVAGMRAGHVVADLLAENLLPDSLASHPAAVAPFLLLRDHLIQRLDEQHTGYWKADGEGMEVFTRADWGRAVDLLAGGSEDRFADAAHSLDDRGDLAMALRIAELGLAAHPRSARLAAERHRALDGLRLEYQFDPFKLIIYSEMAGEAVAPVPPATAPPAR